VRNEKLICTECLISIPKTGFEKERDNFVERLFWGRCRLERAASFAWYVKGGRMSRLIYKFKYDGNRDIGLELGRIYGIDLMTAGFLTGVDYLIPVPLHRKRERKRGFNQSHILASGIALASGIPIISNNLLRVMLSDTQTVRSRIERWGNVEGIFKVADPDALKGFHVLLVDDVITTGSTIDACTTALSKVDGIKVSAVSIAVAPG
jgi:ComF family protein